MVDRQERDQLAAALRAYMDAQITVFELDDAVGRTVAPGDDQTVRAVGLALIVGNIASYLGVRGPLVYYYQVHVGVAEAAVIAVETVFIKLVSLLAVFQADTFTELKWRYALLAAILGNASSYYIGTLIGPEVL